MNALYRFSLCWGFETKMLKETSSRLEQLLQEHGGLFRAAPIFMTGSDTPLMVLRSADLGNVGSLWPEVAKRGKASTIWGGGSGLDPASALLPALAEGLERYCTSVFQNEQFIWASASELGDDALDLDMLPRCSSLELSHPKCPLSLPDKSKRIRWVKGFSLLNGREAYIPAVLVYSHIGYAVPEERFWLPISTGCAAHTSYELAALAAVCEVVERDAISIVWLQKLPLPRIEIDHVSSTLAPFWQRYMAASADLEYIFFDATTDLGVPTVYALQVARYNARLTTLVACSTGTTIASALCKVIRDLATSRLAFRQSATTPDSWYDFTDIVHGATFMARAEVAHAFHFLVHSVSTKHLSEMNSDQAEPISLTMIVDKLRLSNLETYIVDLSTDEATRSGMHVVRAIIPGLQPLSLRHAARFLGHPRLYSVPTAMGYPSQPEAMLNQWPQPFA
jgi:ribosomal protein S12 methylthiotransferase accessory factor